MDDAIVAAVKRFGSMAAGVAIIALNKRLGLGMGPEEIAALSSIIVAYMVQSVWHSNKKLQADAKAAAEATVKTSDDAAAVFNAGAKLLVFALLGALILPGIARADELPADAPKAVHVTAGYSTPSSGTFLPEPLDLREARRVVACEDERDKLRTQGPPAWVVIVSIVGGALLGGGAVLYFKK